MYRPPWVSLIVLFLVGSLTFAQSNPPAPSTPQPQPSPATQSKGFALEDGTPVKLRLSRNVSSADAQVGDGVDFEVLEEINVNGIIVIPKSSLALGTVTEAQSKRRMGRGGKLDMNIDSARLVDGQKAALRAVKRPREGDILGP